MFANRIPLMCIAICGVVFYHLAFLGIHIGRLNIGYAGVDIFMLLSGYGIANSLSRNSLKQFYRNRAKRLLPLWIVTCVICQFVKLGGVNLLGLVSDITTFSFYVNPDSVPEWYLQTLILFYIVSPLLKFIIDRIGWLFVIIISILIVGYCTFIPLYHWQYANAIPRFSLFVLGMTCFIRNRPNLPYSITVPLFLLGIAFFFRNSHYLFSSLCIPFVMQVINILIDRRTIPTVVNWIGNHTLEIYVADIIATETLQPIMTGLPILTKIAVRLTMIVALTLLFNQMEKIYEKIPTIHH